MSAFSDFDRACMARALQLAENGRYAAHPNPMVGCVIVQDGEIIAEGWHAVAGQAHAEINALQAAGKRARGSTAFVTLEPCAHHGKTPPCTVALIEAGVAEVVVGAGDPNPRVSGAGLAALREAGIGVRTGLLQAEVEELNRGFIQRVTQGRPRVRIKIAASLDGRTAMASGESRWITGPEARADVQKWRAASGVVMTGIGTVLADDPSLTVRDPALDVDGRQPLRVVLDNGLRMPVSAKMLTLPGDTVVYCTDDRKRGPLQDAGAAVVKVPAQDGGLIDAGSVLDDLGKREINDVLIEAGPTLAGSLMQRGCVDELVIYLAPHIMGSETLGMFRTPAWKDLGDRRPLQITDIREIGADTRIIARLSG